MATVPKSAGEIIKTTKLSRSKRQRKTVGEGEHTPTDLDLQMYLEWAKGVPTTQIAKSFATPERTARKRLTLVSNWLRSDMLDQLGDLRSTQFYLLMGHYRELDKLRAKLAKAGILQTGALVRVLKEQRETLSQVAVLIGLNVGKKVDEGGDDGEGTRWAGLPQTIAIQRQIALLTERLVVAGQPPEGGSGPAHATSEGAAAAS